MGSWLPPIHSSKISFQQLFHQVLIAETVFYLALEVEPQNTIKATLLLFLSSYH